MNRADVFRHACKTTFPVFTGYLPLGAAFGLLLSQTGFGADIAALMALLMYGGSSQFLAVEMIRSNASLWEMFLMTLFLSARHMVYGLSLIDKFEGNPAKGYMIFALTDEAYALHVGAKPPDAAHEGLWRFFVSLLCQAYWIFGCVAGSVLGALLTFDLTGLDFVLTALFVVLTVDMYLDRRDVKPFAVGAFSGVCALAAPDMLMMPAAIAGILALLLLFRGRLERGGKAK